MTLRLRPARAADAAALGTILWQIQHRADWMPVLWSQRECVGFCAEMIRRGWVHLAEEAGEALGFLARDGEEICALYLANAAKRRGIGKRLLDLAKGHSPRLWLRCAQENGGAQRFYVREGFIETGRSDGRLTEEKVPDITFVWPRKGAR